MAFQISPSSLWRCQLGHISVSRPTTPCHRLIVPGSGFSGERCATLIYQQLDEIDQAAWVLGGEEAVRARYSQDR